MKPEGFLRIKTEGIKTPCFIVDEEAVEENLRVLDSIQKRTGAKIILALKAFSMWSMAPLVMKYLHGVCAGSLHEARLGREEFGKEVHTYCPAFKDDEIGDVIKYSDHIVFNSLTQWQRFKPAIEKARREGKSIEVGLRINPEYSEAQDEHYNPSRPKSRFGVLASELEAQDLEGITGLHFHALCEKYSDTLERVLAHVEEKFYPYLHKMKWMNFGGGHWITKGEYDREHLCKVISDFYKKYPNIQNIYLEPGEAIAIDTGVLVTSVLDIKENKGKAAVLDFSTEAHLNDKIVANFEQEILGAKNGMADEKHPYEYQLGAPSCATGDVLGDYAFSKPLNVGDKLVLLNMAIYSMTKTSTFCGVKLPDIAVYHPDRDEIEVVREFGYSDFKTRLS